MIKMFELKYEGVSFNLFTEGQTYIGRITKKGHLYAFNENGFWSPVKRNDFAKNRLAKFFEVEKEFYVNNYKEALNYPLLEKILNGAKFTFKINKSYDCDIIYNGQLIADEVELDLVTSWISPIYGKKLESSYNLNPSRIEGKDAAEICVELVTSGKWIITSIEDRIKKED